VRKQNTNNVENVRIRECIIKKQIKDLKKYLEDPNREIFEDDSKD
jgi:hypothetical protein